MSYAKFALLAALAMSLTVAPVATGSQSPTAIVGQRAATPVAVHAAHTARSLRPILAATGGRSSTHAAGVGAQAPTADIQVTYNGFSPAAQAAFEAAVVVWESRIASSRVIHVTANWVALGAGVLGSAGPSNLYLLSDNRWHAAALAEAVCDCEGPNPVELNANFNSAFTGWYLGTDGNPPSNKWDFFTVVMHELGHGLGFLGSFKTNATDGSWGWSGYPTRYDEHEWSAATGGSKLTDTSAFGNPSAALKAQLTDGSVFFGGPNVVAAYGGRAPLYAPGTWSGGSSNSHFDEASFAAGTENALMTPFLSNGEVIHEPGPVTLALFRDIGWTTVEGSTDTIPPVVQAPAARFVAPQQLKSNATMRVQWSAATDDSGVAAYELQRRKGTGSWTLVSLSSPTATTVDVNLATGASHTFRLRAIDTHGNVSAWMSTSAAMLAVSQETSASVVYGGGAWTQAALSGASGGALRYAGGVGRFAQFSFSGTSVAFVSTRAPSRGIAQIWLDGVNVATVDLYSPTTLKKAVVWVPAASLAAGAHMLEVRVTGTKNPAATKKRVDVDAFLVWQ